MAEPSRPWSSLISMGQLPVVHDPEGARVPAGRRVFDAHVHLFPPRVFEAIWRWFGKHAWQVRYQLHAEQVVAFLSARGVERMTALVYSHAPGMAEALNAFVAELGARFPQVVPLGTVLPGEPGAAGIVDRALGDMGLRGLKLHCHVQKMAPDDERLFEVYARAQAHGKPVLIHAGREPASEAYGFDCRALCNAERIERVLRAFPELKLVVPHLGADEVDAYLDLLDRHENLWLDTTMAVADYFPLTVDLSRLAEHSSRILYGTDFPNIPYAWDRELGRLEAHPFTEAQRRQIYWDNAAALFGT